MLPTKLLTYIASTLLANTLIVELLPPVYAASAKSCKSRNYVEKLALNSSFQIYADGTLFQGSGAEIYSIQSNQGEVILSPFTSNAWDLTTTTTIRGTTIRGIEQQFFQDFDRLIQNEIEVLDGIELDLDSILTNEFDQGGVLLAECCL
jgi:hypothetical protein